MKGRVIVITSGKGGTGKTVTAINLAAALHSLGKDVILVDANLTTPNIGLHLGAPVVPIALNHVLRGKKSIRQAIYEHHSGLKVVPSSLSLNALKGIKPENLAIAIRELKDIAEILLLDSSAGLGKEALVAIQQADEIIVVTNPELPAVADALKTIKIAEKLKKKITGVIVTRKKGKNEMKIREIAYLLEKPIIGIVPEDKNVSNSIMLRDILININPKSKAAKAYKRIAARLIGEKIEEKINFFAKLFGFLKK
ncbi:MAG: cell division ATPase MinD [Candidatus Pacearchaeota archaeon]|nr:cell division ATPase MinD [Candidatus Pacearchaeota archaeon]